MLQIWQLYLEKVLAYNLNYYQISLIPIHSICWRLENRCIMTIKCSKDTRLISRSFYYKNVISPIYWVLHGSSIDSINCISGRNKTKSICNHDIYYIAFNLMDKFSSWCVPRARYNPSAIRWYVSNSHHKWPVRVCLQLLSGSRGRYYLDVNTPKETWIFARCKE